MIYRVPLFTCFNLEQDLKKEGLNIDEIKVLTYDTVTKGFDISEVRKVALTCFPENKPIENKENKILFCETCPEDKSIFMKVSIKGNHKDSKTKSFVFRLVGGSHGLMFKKVTQEVL